MVPVDCVSTIFSTEYSSNVYTVNPVIPIVVMPLSQQCTACLGHVRMCRMCSLIPKLPYSHAGLNDLIPDNLLGIFDENELEV